MEIQRVIKLEKQSVECKGCLKISRSWVEAGVKSLLVVAKEHWIHWNGSVWVLLPISSKAALILPLLHHMDPPKTLF